MAWLCMIVAVAGAGIVMGPVWLDLPIGLVVWMVDRTVRDKRSRRK